VVSYSQTGLQIFSKTREGQKGQSVVNNFGSETADTFNAQHYGKILWLICITHSDEDARRKPLFCGTFSVCVMLRN
jgi:hypothetical protein